MHGTCIHECGQIKPVCGDRKIVQTTCCAVKLQTLHPSASPAYLYYAGLISFPASLLLLAGMHHLTSPSLSVGTL